jgi:hypothetical protein
MKKQGIKKAILNVAAASFIFFSGAIACSGQINPNTPPTNPPVNPNPTNPNPTSPNPVNPNPANPNPVNPNNPNTNPNTPNPTIQTPTINQPNQMPGQIKRTNPDSLNIRKDTIPKGK